MLCPAIALAVLLPLQQVQAFSLRAPRDELVLPGWHGEQAIIGDPVVYGKV